jgi:hypothetical protein
MPGGRRASWLLYVSRSGKTRIVVLDNSCSISRAGKDQWREWCGGSSARSG